MARRRQLAPLNVYLNNRLVGHLTRSGHGAISFQYDGNWLDWPHTLPVSLSLPLRETAYHGEAVVAVFENLLPDVEALRRTVAEKVGARGTDAYSLLSAIGRDCVGALQFVADDAEQPGVAAAIEGETLNDAAIERLLQNLAQTPLGLTREDDFRISVAGAQEKTALLWHEGRWKKPIGTTPTTHLFKTQIGVLPEGVNLCNSVENEYYCLKLVEAFGLPVNRVEIKTFGSTTALVIERFDRRWTKDGRLLRLPQEDCCQALSVPPTVKYQNRGGPGMVDVIKLFRGSDTPAADQEIFLKAQLLFWLLGATDGHAKNFSLFLNPSGSYRMTPLYDILTVQPNFDAREIEPRQFKLAMSVGKNRHYRVDEIQRRHFEQTGASAGMPKATVQRAIDEIEASAPVAISKVEKDLPKDFPEAIHCSVSKAMQTRLAQLRKGKNVG